VAARSPERVALLSIHPEYADAIFDGEKGVEFRRSRLAPDVSVVLVYATQPVGRVIGWFEVEEVVEASPTRLWDDFSRSGGIARRAYRSYFRGARRAFGIVVRSPQRFATPQMLDEVLPGTRPPQSFQYVLRSDLKAALAG
jgi:predicted transcriptional regulator